MTKGKRIRQKGKVSFSSYFKEIKDGKTVAIVKDLSINIAFPKRIIGKSGKVIGSRGMCKLVELNDGNKKKVFIIHPVHLKVL
jgi:ribosomal protein L21E